MTDHDDSAFARENHWRSLEGRSPAPPQPDPLRDRCKKFLASIEARRPTHQQSTFVLLQTQIVDDLMAFVREERQRALAPGVEGVVRDALKPFTDFMAGGSFNKIPDDVPLTVGSSMARRQITAGHLRKLAAAIVGPGGDQ